VKGSDGDAGGGGVLAGLNPEQREAVRHFEGPALVLAGAGSGKTRVLTTRIVELISRHGVPPERILSVTFTNKAAGEMKERIRRQLGEDPAGMWMGTFHSVGARLLRRHADLLGWTRSFTIADAEQSLRRVKRVLDVLNLDAKRFNPKAVRSTISQAKNQLITPAQFAAENGEGFDLFAKAVARVYPLYEEELRDTNSFDFDDLLVKPVDLLESEPRILERYRDQFAFVLVDEYQDTNRAQFRFLELVAGGHGNLMVVGDDDQSIYGWRGADVRNILDFETAFPGAVVVRLEQNYRSSERILDAANAVIRQNVMRKGKTLRTDREGGEPLTLVQCADEVDEAAWIVEEIQARIRDNPLTRSLRSFAVLYRTNAQSRALEDAFRRRGIAYQIVGGVRFYERREIQDVLAYLRLLSNPRDVDAFERIVNWPRRGIGGTSQDRLRQWAREHGHPLLEAAGLAELIPDLTGAAVRAYKTFAERIQHFSIEAARLPVGELLEELVEEMDLIRHLQEEGPDGDDRAENVRELIAGAMEFESDALEGLDQEERDRFSDLDLYLQQVALVADVDRHDPDADAVVLMTLHNAKGLEFPVVFLAGLEDGLFPLGRAYDEPAQLEEERRLFYVGLTRAEDKLYLLHARQRRRAGDLMVGRVSSFVQGIPQALLENRETDRYRREHGGFERRMSRGESTGGGSWSGSDEFGAGLESRRSPGAGPAQGSREEPHDEMDPGMEAGMNQDSPRYVKGERVLHATFGSGRILEVSGYGKDIRVTVQFDSVGAKKLLVRYAGLERDYE
jgi:DNA helicase II / ATP-dependent DNA helicase PcrA